MDMQRLKSIRNQDFTNQFQKNSSDSFESKRKIEELERKNSRKILHQKDRTVQLFNEILRPYQLDKTQKLKMQLSCYGDFSISHWNVSRDNITKTIKKYLEFRKIEYVYDPELENFDCMICSIQRQKKLSNLIDFSN